MGRYMQHTTSKTLNSAPPVQHQRNYSELIKSALGQYPSSVTQTYTCKWWKYAYRPSAMVHMKAFKLRPSSPTSKEAHTVNRICLRPISLIDKRNTNVYSGSTHNNTDLVLYTCMQFQLYQSCFARVSTLMVVVIGYMYIQAVNSQAFHYTSSSKKEMKEPTGLAENRCNKLNDVR